MLDAPEFAKRLCAAMDYREPPLRTVDLAATMGVSKQVVYEWRTTGRISKGRLVQLAEATGMPLEFYLEPERGGSPTTRAIWRKLSRLFVRVASIFLALCLAMLIPSPAEAGSRLAGSVYYVKRLKRFLFRSATNSLRILTDSLRFA